MTNGRAQDWTCNPTTGYSNSSPLFEQLVDEVTNMIRDDAHQLLAGNAHMTARLIVAQLAHVYGLAPRGDGETPSPAKEG